jgi:hypothetical protein
MYRVADPLVRFHQLVLARHEGLLVRGEAARIWADVADTVASKIYGPHFEDLAREWALAHAAEETLGGRPNWVRPATVSCRDHRDGHELDLVAMQSLPFQQDHVLAIGEAKAAGKPMGTAELERLEHLRSLLPPDKVGSSPPRLVLFGRTGFTPALQTVAGTRADIALVDLDRLYHGA